jgi:hypothetical protein
MNNELDNELAFPTFIITNGGGDVSEIGLPDAYAGVQQLMVWCNMTRSLGSLRIRRSYANVIMGLPRYDGFTKVVDDFTECPCSLSYKAW